MNASSPKEARAHLMTVDQALRNNKTVEAEDKKVVLTVIYREQGWGGPRPTPLPKAATDALELEDKTGDGRWSAHFVNNMGHLGLYRTRVGYYWLLAYDADGNHTLQHAGAAGEVEARFGKKK